MNGVAAGLTPLAFVGGPTRVHLPTSGSPLLGWSRLIVGTDFPAADQRGYARPVGLAGDVGAVERQAKRPAPIRRWRTCRW